MKHYNNTTVSIITPVFNCEKLIEETIKCVKNQTYKEWEMIIVNDGSTDKTEDVIKKFLQDSRIKYYKLETNSGVAVARNYALNKISGRFVAYLDADDLWKKDKLEKQISFMKENNYAFTCTDYEKIDEEGNSLKEVKIPNKINYEKFLKNTIIQTVGVMVDAFITGKELLVMPNIRTRQDAATWSQLLKNGFNCYRIPENLSYYRLVPKSLSSNKFKMIKNNWNWYRNIEKLPFLKSCYCWCWYIVNAIKKRIYVKKYLRALKQKINKIKQKS